MGKSDDRLRVEIESLQLEIGVDFAPGNGDVIFSVHP